MSGGQGMDRVEIQLGHLCNNRCVFCISGHLTHRKEAPLLPAILIRQRLREARAAGIEHLTFLGGEPTIQPSFMDVLEFAVELGFSTIVVFSNGTRLHRPGMLERILETGGHFEFRLSFQGGNEAAHERTTRRRGSWRQLVDSLERARTLEQRVTVNMCVVQSNHESIVDFPALLEPHGVAHLHLDMIHPDDTPVAKGVGGEALADIMPRYRDVATSLRRMSAALGPGIQLSIGNLPHCIAPELVPHIHHGGVETQTNTAGVLGAAMLAPGHDKYAEKRAHKHHPDRCRECLFRTQCSGIFDQYAELYGDDELVPVQAIDLARAGALAPGLAELLARLHAAAPFGSLQWGGIALPRPDRLELRLDHPSGGRVHVWFDPSHRPRAGYSLERIDPNRPPEGLANEVRRLFEVAREPATAVQSDGGSEQSPRRAGDSPLPPGTRSG